MGEALNTRYAHAHALPTMNNLIEREAWRTAWITARRSEGKQRLRIVSNRREYPLPPTLSLYHHHFPLHTHTYTIYFACPLVDLPSFDSFIVAERLQWLLAFTTEAGKSLRCSMMMLLLSVLFIYRAAVVATNVKR